MSERSLVTHRVFHRCGKAKISLNISNIQFISDYLGDIVTDTCRFVE